MSGAEQNVFYPPERATMQRLSTAQELLDQKRYGEAVRLLDKILEEPEDYFFQPNRNEPVYRSLKGEAQRLLGAMPPEGQESYELQFGARARQMLDEAVARGDAAGLATVSRRYFHTQAGYEATYLLGTVEMDQGRPLVAALCLRRLQDAPAAVRRFDPTLSVRAAACWLRAGMAETASATLVELKHRQPDARLTIGGREQNLFATDAEALTWLKRLAGEHILAVSRLGADQWAVFRGGPSRNTVSAGGSPLMNRRWAIPVANDRQLGERLQTMRQKFLEDGTRILPSLQPLAVDNFVFIRSLAGLEAIDFRTGKRIWNDDPTEPSVVEMIEHSGQPAQFRGQGPLATWLAQRVWDDSVYGALSSDGELLFCVQDLGPPTLNRPGVPGQPMVVLPNGRISIDAAQPTFNRLVAYSIATEGKLKWEVGGQPGEGQLPRAGAFFLGPPLPLAGRLYAIAEIKSDVRLLVLDAKTGELDWSQQLAFVETPVTQDPLRRVAGAMPSYADGVLVCPTAAGAVVAVDLTTRSLLWGYQYPRAIESNYANRVFQFRMGGFAPMNEAGETERWTDATVTIAEGKVLLTPLESNNLHCLNLLDGKLLWQKPREDGLYLACVDRGKAVVAGRRGLRAYRIADGEPAWSKPLALPEGSTPSGRGFFNGDRYFLPLSSAEVAAIDVESGSIAAYSRSRSGSVPGNLICYRGAVVSQGVDQVECFFQLDDLRRQVAATLAEHPDDPEALAQHGELLLDEGQLAEAVGQLRRSYELRSDRRTRELLVDALLEGLRTNFAEYRGQLDEIERLAEQPSQQDQFQRLAALGFQRSGETAAAFRAYLRLAPAGARYQPMVHLNNALEVRRDRWIQTRLVDLYAAAGPAERSEIDAELGRRLTSAQERGAAGLREFIAYFGNHLAADEARELLAAQLIASHELLEAELLLRTLERSASPERQRAAVARLARMLAQAERPSEAEVYCRKLERHFADVPCLAGKTGRQVVSELAAAGGELALRLGAAARFPIGRVKRETTSVEPMPPYPRFRIEVRGAQRPFFDRAIVELDQQQGVLIGRDGLGIERWRATLRDRGDGAGMMFNPQSSQARADGSFLLVSLGTQVAAIDTLGNGKGNERILWRQELSDSFYGIQRGLNVRQMNVIGMQQFQAFDMNNRPIGGIGPAGTEFACFQRARNLMAVHPLTGDVLWTRRDIPHGSDLIGDETMLIVMPPDSDEAIVLRTLDGEELGRRPVPLAEERLATVGRMILSWAVPDDGGKAVLKLTDPWEQKHLWEHSFDSEAKCFAVADEAVGVLEKSGHFVLISLSDGQKTIDENVNPEPSLHEIFVLRSPTHDLLLTNRSPRRGNNVIALNGGQWAILVNGFVHGFDRRTGQKLYSTRIEGKGLSLNQPAEVPVLTFASMHMQALRTNGHAPEGHVACLDKRTGKFVYDEKLDQVNNVDVTGDAKAHSVLVRTMRSTVKLVFTDEPVDDAGAAGSEKRAKADTTPLRAGRALARGFRRWAAELDQEPAAGQPKEPAAKENE